MSLGAPTRDDEANNNCHHRHIDHQEIENFHRWMSSLPISVATLRAYQTFEDGAFTYLIRCRECRITVFGIQFCGDCHKSFAGPCRCASAFLPCIRHRPDRYLRVAYELIGRDAVVQRLTATTTTDNKDNIVDLCKRVASSLLSECHGQCHIWIVAIIAIMFVCIATFLISYSPHVT